MADFKTQPETEIHAVSGNGSRGSPNNTSPSYDNTSKDTTPTPPTPPSTPSAIDTAKDDPEANPNSPQPKRTKFRITMILAAIYLSLFVAALNATVVGTAIPTIVAELHSPSGYSWIGGAYLIANAAASPIWAKLSDIWGRKPILLITVAWFSGASIICATAVDMKMLIVGRALQGTASGGIILLTNVVVSDVFSMRERSLYLGYCEAIWAAAGAIGPILGGVLTGLASWRWCWWINLPICAIAGLLLLFFLDVHNPRTSIRKGVKAIDWAGSLSILAVVILLLLGLDFGGATFPWTSPKVICLIVFGALCILVFIFAEKRPQNRYPLMPIQLFRESSNIASLLVTAWHGMVFIAGEYYFPLYLQSAKAASPLRSGVLLVPLLFTTAACGVVTGVVIHRYGRYRELNWIGTVLLTAGFGAFISLTPSTSIASIVGFQLIAGAGSGLLFEPPLVALQAFSAQDDVATATSTFSFVRALALAVSIILGGVVFQNSMDARTPLLRAAGLPTDLVEALSGRNAAANVMLTHTIQDAGQREVVKEAFSWSMRNMWIMYTVLGALGVVSSAFVKGKKLSTEHTETVTGLKEEKVMDVLLHPLQAVRSHVGSHEGGGGGGVNDSQGRQEQEGVVR